MSGLPRQPHIPGLARADKKPRAPRQANPELVQQCHYFRFVRLHAPRYPALRWIHSSLNGAYLARKTKADMAASGMTAGIWDIFIPVPRAELGGAYIEMKWGKNRLTENQHRFLHEVILPGRFSYCVAYSWIEAAVFTLDYLGIDDREIREALR